MLSTKNAPCRLSGDTGDMRDAYVVVPREGVLPAYDCVTVNKATKLMRIRDSSCDGRKLSK